MRRYKNESKINRTVMADNVCVKCSYAESFTRPRVEIEIEHGEWYVDFDDIREYFAKLNGGTFAQEELVAEVFETMWREYEPIHLRVSVHEDTAPETVISRYA